LRAFYTDCITPSLVKHIGTVYRHGLLSEKHNSEKDFLLKRLEQLLAGKEWSNSGQVRNGEAVYVRNGETPGR
jgi:hypothetical protein